MWKLTWSDMVTTTVLDYQSAYHSPCKQYRQVKYNDRDGTKPKRNMVQEQFFSQTNWDKVDYASSIIRAITELIKDTILRMLSFYDVRS